MRIERIRKVSVELEAERKVAVRSGYGVRRKVGEGFRGVGLREGGRVG